MVIVLLAMAARWAVIGPELDRLDDPDGYLHLARSLVRGEGLRLAGRLTAYRPPLYPLLLAPWVLACDGPWLATALKAFHLGLGAMTIVGVADATRRWGFRRRLAWVAAGLVAFDPVLVVQGRSLMTETLAAALVSFTLWGCSLAGRAGPLVGGLGFGLAALCRPSLLPAAGLTALGCLLTGPDGARSRLGRAAILLGATIAVLTPWAVRNRSVLGETVWTTTHGGYTLALANNPTYYADVLDGPPGAVWSGPRQIAWIDGINADTAGLTEPESDRLLRRQAVRFAASHPADFLRATGARLGRFWGLMPSSAVYPGPLRWATAVWTAPFWVLVTVGLCHRRAYRWPLAVVPAMLITLTIIHAAYWTDLRMRAPLVPALAVLAVLGLDAAGSVATRSGRARAELGGGPERRARSTKNAKFPIFLLGKNGRFH